MKKNQKLKNILFQISAILILVAATLYYFEPNIAKYIMMVGVAGYAAITFTTPYPGKDIRGKRLFNIQILAVLLMAVSTYLMYIDMNAWFLALFISALLTLYCSIILPRTYKKELEKEQKN